MWYSDPRLVHSSMGRQREVCLRDRDGGNWERLAALISAQAGAAQFRVVSHRRPMIAASTRTIGVTQARGAHTQVVGLPAAA